MACLTWLVFSYLVMSTHAQHAARHVRQSPVVTSSSPPDLQHQADDAEMDGGSGGSGDGPGLAKEGGSASPVSLGEILGLLFLVCCILYCIGIGWKIFKIFKGTYVEEEPVFLKYK